MPGETLLLVEDEEDVRMLLALVLRGDGYAVLLAGDAAEALRRAERHAGPIHLLVTDVVLPGPGGRRLGGQLQAVRPDLYLSGHTDDMLARHDLREAEVPFLRKPFSPTALTYQVREVLDSPHR